MAFKSIPFDATSCTPAYDVRVIPPDGTEPLWQLVHEFFIMEDIVAEYVTFVVSHSVVREG